MIRHRSDLRPAREPGQRPAGGSRNGSRQEYFGATPFITLPTGRYDQDRPLNLRENRWKFTLQAAYVTPVVTKDLLLQVSGDLTFYTANKNYGVTAQRVTQRPQGRFQASLRDNVTPDFDPRVGASQFVGGAPAWTEFPTRTG